MIQKPNSDFKAGAGKTEIVFPKEAFPTKPENYTGIHDNPHVRVLILESNEEKFVLVNFELVSLDDYIEDLQNRVAKRTGISTDRIWICVAHVLSTPHVLSVSNMADCEASICQEALYRALEQAMEEAVEEAVKRLSPAKIAIGSGACSINVNRVISTEKGWWIGNNEHGPTDPSVTVWRFDDMEGNTIGILYNYNSQCSIMDGSYTMSGERLISGDLASASSQFIEKEYDGKAIAMYCLGVGGDQAPELKAIRTRRRRGGIAETIDIHEQGYLLVELLGERLGQEVIEITERLKTEPLKEPFRIRHRIFSYAKQFTPKMDDIVPTKEYVYRPEAKLETPVEILQIANSVLIGVQPEMCVRTLKDIKKRSPFEVTGMMTFVNGGAKYMPEEDYYDMITFQSMNSHFVKGSAEQFEEDILRLLEEIYQEIQQEVKE